MSEEPAPKPRSIGLTEPAPDSASRLATADWMALALTVLWLVLCLVVLLVLPRPQTAEPFTLVMAGLAVLMPVALIWVAAAAVKANRVMREESARLQAAVDALRHAYIAQNQARGSGLRPPIEHKLDEIARTQKRAEALLAELAATRPDPAPALPSTPTPTPTPVPTAEPARAQEPPAEAQPALALGTPEGAAPAPISTDDFIRALNFPETETDRDGFRALRRALKDHATAGLVRSAQDVLTLLAEDGIYMDDLSPDRARPEIWRQFARGERGRSIAGLGGVRDRSSLALAAGRMRQDPVFRDAAHHFLRKFDHTFAGFEPTASDADIVALSDTRTARAFMLIGRISGTFD